MKMIGLVVATAAAVSTAASFAGVISANAGGLQIAQAGVDVQVGRDRDRYRDEHRDSRDSGVTIGVGPGGVRVGPRERCRTVTTTVQRDDGRTVTRKERQCD
jgi:opacity protein-like surface antigen